MPQVPRLQPMGVQQAAMPSVRTSTDVNEEALGIGRSQQILDKSMQNLAMTGVQIAQEEKKKADDAITTDYYAKIAQKKIDLYYGKEGVTSKQGKDSFSALDDYGKQFDSYADELEKGLSNDTQRAMARQIRDKERMEFANLTHKHMSVEREKFEKQAADAGIATAQQDAALSPYDNDVISDKLRIQASLIMSANRGAPDEMIGYKIADAHSKTHYGVISQMLSDKNPYKADKYLKQNANQMHTDEREKANKLITTELVDANSSAIADRVLTKEGFTSEAAAFARIDELTKDKDTRDAAKRNVKLSIGLQDKEQRENYNLLRSSVAEAIESGKSIKDLTPDIKGNLKPDDLRALQALEEQKLKLREVKNDPKVYAKYDNMSQLELGQVSLGELVTKARTNISEENWQRLHSKWKAAKEPFKTDKKGNDWQGFETKDTMLFRAMQDAKLYGIDENRRKDELSDKQKDNYAILQRELDAELDPNNFGGKKPSHEVIKQKAEEIVKRRAFKVEGMRTSGMIFDSDIDKPIAEMSDSEKEKAYVKFEKIPDAEKNRMLNVLKANNATRGMSDEEFLSALNNPDSPSGKVYRKRMEKAYAAGILGKKSEIKSKLLGN